MSTIANLLRLPKYARNFGRIRHIVRVVVHHGFGHVLVRGGLDRYASLFDRGLVLADADDEMASLAWEQRVRMCLEALGPTYIKLGQVAATRPDLIPMSLVHELRKLQDHVVGFGFDEVRAVVAAELGAPLESLFATFDPQPLAAASIAQVHRATLVSGEQVVVKVQRPGLEKAIQVDLDLLATLAVTLEAQVPELQQFRLTVAIDEFSRNLKRETDFTNERDNLERYRRIILDNPDVHVPVTYPLLSSRRVLTMEFLDGCKVTDKERLEAWQIDGEKIARVGTALFLKSVFEHGFFHADPHPGNFFVLRPRADEPAVGGRIGLIDFGSMGTIDNETLDELLTFLVSLLLGDPEMLVTQFVDLGLVDDTVNVRGMSAEVSEIMRRYNGVTLERLDIAAFITEVFEAVVRYQVRLPSELILIGKAISTMTGIAQEIYPAYDPLAELRPYLVQLYVKRVLDPKTYSRRLYRVLHDWWGLVRVTPGEIRGLLRRARTGELQLQLRQPDLELARSRTERVVNRGLLAAWSIAAWLLFTWLLPQVVAAPPWGTLWWYEILLAAQGLTALALALLSWLRSREL